MEYLSTKIKANMKQLSCVLIILMSLQVLGQSDIQIKVMGADEKLRTAIEKNTIELLSALNNAVLSQSDLDFSFVKINGEAKKMVISLCEKGRVVFMTASYKEEYSKLSSGGYQLKSIPIVILPSQKQNLVIHFTKDGIINNVLMISPEQAEASEKKQQSTKPEPIVVSSVDLKAYTMKGDSCFYAGNYKCAIENYQLFEKQSPEKEEVNKHLANSKECLRLSNVADQFFAQKKYIEAEPQYQRILEINPKDVKAKENFDYCKQSLINKAGDCFVNADYICAVDNYRSFLANNTNKEATKKLDEAEKCLEYLNVANYLFEQKDYVEAEIQYKKILELNPSDSKTQERFNLCSKHTSLVKGVNCMKKGDYDCAKDFYLKFLQETSDSKEGVDSILKVIDECRKILNITEHLLKSKKYEEVKVQYQKILQLNPDDEQAKALANLCVKYQDLISFSESKSFSELTSVYENMIPIAGGTFIMGCTSEQGDDCFVNEKPSRQVRLNSFMMSRTEITNKQYAEFLNALKVDSTTIYNGKKMINPVAVYYAVRVKYSNDFWQVVPTYENHPVTCVTWDGANEYCKWAKGRLPTEAEWEFAARGGHKSKKSKYSGSNNIEEVAWYSDNSDNKVYPVAQKKSNELGLFDMSGNVYEWCSDWYSFPYPSESQTNPIGPIGGTDKVIRGGDWGRKDQFCRTSFRVNSAPESGHNFLGFRLLLE